MIHYIVELELDAALRGEYLPWLRGHVREMLALPGFIDAVILTRTDPAPPAGRAVLVTEYRLRDRAAFDDYVALHAARMRAAGSLRFGDCVRSSRQVLEDP